MTLEVTSRLTEGRSPRWVSLHLAIGVYVSGEASLGQAAEVAGMTKREFQHELCVRKIPLNYSMDDLNKDLEAVRELSSR
jgi:predicted HTH domain antitoxin